MGAVEFKTWKELVKYGELTEDMIRRIRKQHSTRSTPTNKQHPQSSGYKEKEVMAAGTAPGSEVSRSEGEKRFPTRATPIPARKMVLINHDLHNLRQKGLSPIITKKGEIIWVHPDLLKDEKWSSPNS